MNTRAVFIVVFCLLASFSANAQTQTTTSRLYLFNPDSTDIKNSIEGLEEAIKTRTVRPSKKLGLVPNTLPDRPNEPSSKAFHMGPITVNMLDCGDAYGQIATSGTTDGGLLGSSGERFFGCAYLSKSGIRLAVILEQNTRSSSGLLGSLMTGIRDSIRGDDQKFGRESFDKMVAAIRQKAPGVLVELVELPGGDISRPDGEQVVAILNKAAPSTIPPAVIAPTTLSALALTATSATTVSTVAKPIPGTTQALEARKQLLSIGLSYFSLDNFHDAIRRKDTLAVELFLQANAVSVSTQNTKGQTAIDVAKTTSDPEILAMIERSAK